MALLFCNVYGTVRVNAQGNSVITYESKDGNNSGNIASILRDSRGRIWSFGYSNGVSMYDGSRWVNYSLNDGLSSVCCGEFYEDYQGNIWIVHSDSPYLDLINSHGIKNYFFSGSSIRGMFFEKDGRRSCLLKKGDTWTILKNVPAKDTFVISSEITFNKDASVYKNQLKNTLYLTDKKSMYLVNEKGFTRLNTSNLSFFNAPNIFGFVDPDQYFTNENGDIYRYNHGKKSLINPSYLHSPYGPSKKIKSRYRGMNFDFPYGRYYIIWSLAEKNHYLLQEYDIRNHHIVNALTFRSNFVPKVWTKDAAGNYWIGTESNVQKVLCYQYCIPVGASNYMNETWALSQAPDGKLWMASYGKGVRFFDGYGLQMPPPSFTSLDEAFFDDMAMQCSDGSMVFNLERNPKVNGLKNIPGIVRIKNNSWSFIPKKNPAIFFGRDNSGRLMQGTFNDGLKIYKTDLDLSEKNLYLHINASKGLRLTNVICALQDTFGRYWMTRSSQGISMYDTTTKKIVNWLVTDDKENIGATSIEEDSHGNLWIGSTKGLYFFENRKAIGQDFKLKNHYVKMGEDYIGNSHIKLTRMIDDSTLLVGNDMGYYLVNLNAFYSKNKKNITFHGVFTESMGNFPGGSVMQNGHFKSADGCFWLLTDNGIFRHDPTKYVQATWNKRLSIDSIRNGKYLYLKNFNAINLSFRNPSIKIYFSTPPDSLLYDNVFYQWRLNNEPWSKPSRDGSIAYFNLNSGRYTFSVRIVVDGHYSLSKTVSFQISPPWWLKWQVWLASMILVLAIVLFLNQKQRKIYSQQLMLSQKETEVEIMSKEKDMLRVHAIVNQLNPHFINNTLQWLQIRVDDDQEAVKVIGRLAENISTVFRNSRRKISFHSLENELLLASNYLYIQKVRFGDRLKIQVMDLAELSDLKEVMVPIMIIQIHAENAVEHGIRNNDDGSGTVSIRVKDAGEYVEIDIEDDGVGREAANRMGSKGTQNGTTMLSELERIYNKKNKMKISQTYIDKIFLRDDGSGYGTRVEIRIPKEYEYVV
ncbi:MAG: histidine kinase [Saprospiraceae bacterium]|nr:histidine kinase [Saprospiraceae bacterium]